MHSAKLLALSAAMIAEACSQSSDPPSETESVQIPQDESELKAERAERLAYEEELAQAPVYRSEIRDLLVENPDLYQGTYRPNVDRFRGLAREFQCTHPVHIVEAAQADDWQLVKCDRWQAVFFRRLAEPRLGRSHGPSIPDYFETMIIDFGIADESRDAGSDPALSHLYQEARLGTRVEVDEVRTYISNEIPSRLQYRKRNTNDNFAFYIIDHDNLTSIRLHSARYPGAFVRNGFGRIVTDSFGISLDSPISNYNDFVGQMQMLSRYIGETE